MTISDWAALGGTIVAVPAFCVALDTYLRAKRKEERDRELATYNVIADRYQAFLQLTIEHPALDIYDDRSLTFVENTPEWRQRLTIMALLIDLFECAFVLYEDQNSAWKKRQWEGWEDYFIFWSQKPAFREAWATLRVDLMDGEFYRLMCERLQQPRIKPSAAQPVSPALEPPSRMANPGRSNQRSDQA